MAAKENVLKESIISFFKNLPIQEIAEEVGYCKRKRKLDMVIFFSSLLFCFGTGIKRSIEVIRQAYITASKTTIARSSFYNRFNPQMVLMMRGLLKQACEEACESIPALKKKLREFTQLIVIDATVMKVHNFLHNVFPSRRKGKGRGKTKAVVKMELVINPFKTVPIKVKITPEKENSMKLLEIGEWVKGKLLLFDLGYFSYKLFHDIDTCGGYFISRLKDCADPLIVEDNSAHKVWNSCFLGKKLKEILQCNIGAVLDFKTLIKVRPYRNCSDSEIINRYMRVVCIYNLEEGRYHRYITNIPYHMIGSHDIARIYRVRWEIEMIFKELKSFFRLHEFPTSKAEIVEVLIYAAILSLVLNRKILSVLRRSAGIAPSKSPERHWTARFAGIAFVLHVALRIKSISELWDFLEEYLKWAMLSPNVNEPHNLDIGRA